MLRNTTNISGNDIDYENPNDNSCHFANLDVAFNPSGLMNDFQNKMVSKNPFSQKLMENDVFDINDLKISQQSEEKIDNNIDQMIGALYNSDHEFTKQNGVQIPLTRQQYYLTQQHGSELLEKFKSHDTSCTINGMNFFKFLLLLILIAALIYGIYWLYKENDYTKSTISRGNN